MELSEDLKEKLKSLGLAISSALSESTRIADAVGVIKEQGYDLVLVLEATIGLSQTQGPGDHRTPSENPSTEAREFKMNITASDKEFLKALRIRLEETNPQEISGPRDES